MADVRLESGASERNESQLPQRRWLPQPALFYGRQAERERLLQSLADTSRVGVVVSGIAGGGKSHLVAVAAWEACSHYEHAAWVDLRETAQRTTEELLRAVLNCLFPAANDQDPLIELARQLTVSPTLIVLDHLDELSDYEQVALVRFIGMLPRTRSHVVMTSAKSLRVVEDSSQVVVQSLDHALDEAAARQLIAEFAQGTFGDGASGGTDLDEQTTQRLISRLHGHPQLLIWAVGLAARGARRLTMLLAVMPDEQQEQPREVTSLLVQGLEPEAQRVVPLLSFFATGTMTPEALKAACVAAVEADQPAGTGSPSAAGQDLSWVVRGPQQLLKSGLLMHDKVRDLYLCPQLLLNEASRLIVPGQQCGLVTLRLLMHYAEAVRAAKDQFDRLDRIATPTRLLMEGFWSQRTKASPVDRILVALAEAFSTYWQQRGSRRLIQTWNERIERITGVRPVTPASESAKQSFGPDKPAGGVTQNPANVVARFQQVLSEWLQLSDADRSRRWAQLALQNPDPVETALLWLAHSVTSFQNGDVSGCDAALKQADQLAASIGRNDVRDLAASLAEQRMGAQAAAGAVQEHLAPALKFLEKGNAHDAVPLLEKALSAARETQQPLAIASCLFYLGRSQSLLGASAKAAVLLNEALSFATQAKDERLIAEIKERLGQIKE